MPRKLLDNDSLPTLVQERLSMWGKCIHAQRLQQRVTSADLCERMGISENTLRRLERGDPGAGAGTYLTALLTLGMVDDLAPSIPPELAASSHRRVKKTLQERSASHDTEYF